MEKQNSTEIVFIVEGSTGEYSDDREWPVAAFRTELAAQERVAAATARARQIIAEADRGDTNLRDAVNEFDRSMEVDYTGVHYSYYQITVE